MKIKYLTCDGETVFVEEIVSLEFGSYILNKNILAIECVRPDGRDFQVDCNNVIEIVT